MSCDARSSAQDSQSSLARMFGVALTTGSTIEEVRDWPRVISAVTADDITSVLARAIMRRRTESRIDDEDLPPSSRSDDDVWATSP